VGILPARVRRAKDKAKAEAGVRLVQMWILAALRKRQFFSLAELNESIAELLIKLNQRPFRKLPGSRAELYATIDRPALQPLPAQRFVFAEWKKARINIDYHVELDGHYYSAPYQLVGKQVEVRFTSGTVEILYQGKRVASHVRSRKAHAHTTLPEHRPKSHQQYLEWTPSRIVDWAAQTGPFTGHLVAAVLAEKPHPEMGYRAALGVISLAADLVASGFSRTLTGVWGQPNRGRPTSPESCPTWNGIVPRFKRNDASSGKRDEETK
jgi:transposase